MVNETVRTVDAQAAVGRVVAAVLGFAFPLHQVRFRHDEHVPESSIEIVGHSVGGITYRR